MPDLRLSLTAKLLGIYVMPRPSACTQPLPLGVHSGSADQGQSTTLNRSILHDDHKFLKHWLWIQDRYMLLEVKKLTTTPPDQLSLADKIRKTKVLAPFVVLIYCLVVKGGMFDGWHGWYYALQRFLAETLLALRLIEHDLTAHPPDQDAKGSNQFSH